MRRRRAPVSKFSAKPYVVTRTLQLVSREAIVLAATERGLRLETGKYDKKNRPVLVPLLTIAEQLGIDAIEYFRSQREASRFVELKHAEAAGTVWDLKRNPCFPLHTRNPQGHKVQITKYTGDFEYWEELQDTHLAVRLFEEKAGKQHIIEESKGFPTPDWELRRKWVEEEYGIKIRVT